MKKVNVNELANDIVSISKQIAVLNGLLVAKKQTMAKYFDKVGKRSMSNDEATIFVQERTSVDYDVKKLEEKLDKEILSEFIDKSYTVNDWKEFIKFMKENGISGKDLKQYISVEKKVDKNKLSKLYEHGEIELSDLEGCYVAKVTKSIVVKIKDPEGKTNEISLS